jgi:hypothetical protein
MFSSLSLSKVMAGNNVDVLIVGLGPVGAIAANILGQRGHSILIVERGDGGGLKVSLSLSLSLSCILVSLSKCLFPAVVVCVCVCLYAASCRRF